MTTPKVTQRQVPVESHKPGAQQLLMKGSCVAPQNYEKAILAIKNQCSDIGSRLYLTDGFRTEYAKIKGNVVSRRIAEGCGQAEYYAPDKKNIELNQDVLRCINRSVVSRAVSDIPGGKKVLGALKKAVDESIPGHWEKYKEYYMWGGGTLFTFFLFGKHAIDAWRGRGGGGSSVTGGQNETETKTQTETKPAPKIEAEAPEGEVEGESKLSKMVAIDGSSFELFALRAYKVLRNVDATREFILKHGHDFESLNLLSNTAFAQTVREYAMYDGTIDMPVSTTPAKAKVPMTTAAHDLIASGAAYLNQSHVKASIQKFRLEHVDEKIAVLRGRDGKLYTLPKVKLPASARVRSVVSVNVAALKPAPVGFRVPVRVMP